MQVYTWDKAGFEKAYWKQYYKQRGCGAARAHNCKCTEVDITYSRLFFENDNLFKERAQNIINKLSLQQSADIFVAGCGLGFLMEAFKELGMNAWGCDNSQYIQIIKNKEKAKSAIHNISILDSQFVTKVRNATGAMWFDVVVTEDLLTSHDDYNTILSNCQALLNTESPKSNIVHIVDTKCSAPFISKPLSNWKAHDSSHTWLNVLGLEE